MTTTKREIGPVGTAIRVLMGAGLLYLAGGANGISWRVPWFGWLIGFVALPAIAVALGLAACRYASGPLRFTGRLGISLNLAVIAALVSNPYTGSGAALFYGATMLIAAWRGQAGCEATVISNLLLNRDDQIGCPTLTPIDAAEAHLRRRAAMADAPLTHHDAREHEPSHEDRREPGAKAVWGHSLAAAGVCVGAAVAIALIVILGQPE